MRKRTVGTWVAAAVLALLGATAALGADPGPFPVADLARSKAGEARALLEGACGSEVEESARVADTLLTVSCGDYAVTAVFWKDGLVALRVQFGGLVTEEEAYGAMGLKPPVEAEGEGEEDPVATAPFREGEGGVRVAAVFKKTPKAIFVGGFELWPNAALSEEWQRELAREGAEEDE
ncbi:MAG: hypothetical protein AB1347_07245 [Acidobacteriota bacterium]